MKKYFKLIVLTLLLGTFGCDDLEINREDFASFESTDFEFGVTREGESTNEITVYTNSISNSDRNFNISVVTEESDLDTSAYNLPLTVTIPSGTNKGKLPITIKDLNIGEENKSLVLRLESTDGSFTGENIALNIFRVCDKNELIIDFIFDDYPEETSWELIEGTSSIVASVETYEGETSASEKLCLPDGEYTFIVYDVFEDGFCCDFGEGSYTISIDGNTISTGGSFSAPSEEVTFSLPFTP